MNKNTIFKYIIILFLIIVSNVFIVNYCSLEDGNISLTYTVKSNEIGEYQLFYMLGTEWRIEDSQTIEYTNVGREQELKYTIPKDTKVLRFDFTEKPSKIILSDIKLKYYFKTISLDQKIFLDKVNYNQIKDVNGNGDKLEIITDGNDPYIVYKLDSSKIIDDLTTQKYKVDNILKLMLILIVDILILLISKKSSSIITLFSESKNNRSLIWSLSKNDFKTKYAGSYLGIIWAFVQPIVTILLYWFVFGFGLKAGAPIPNVPFVVWFITGLIPWFFFQEALMNATNCMLEYSYLVKKVLFKISILPIVKVISSVFVHCAFICFLIIVATVYGFRPSQYTVQLIYYSFCTFCLALAISYTTSAIVVFFRDLGQIINIVLQIGMWMTPIMWSYTIFPERYQWILKLNPMYYIVEGYRDTIINNVWFFERYFQTIYFWIIVLLLFSIGTIIFKKLKPHFADVL